MPSRHGFTLGPGRFHLPDTQHIIETAHGRRIAPQHIQGAVDGLARGDVGLVDVHVHVGGSPVILTHGMHRRRIGIDAAILLTDFPAAIADKHAGGGDDVLSERRRPDEHEPVDIGHGKLAGRVAIQIMRRHDIQHG